MTSPTESDHPVAAPAPVCSCLWLDAQGVIVRADAGVTGLLGGGAQPGARWIDLVDVSHRARTARMLGSAREFQVSGPLRFAAAPGHGAALAVSAAMDPDASELMLLRIEAPPAAGSPAPGPSAADLRMALEAAQVGVWMSDPQSNEMMADGVARRLHGHGPEARLDHVTALQSVHPDDRPGLQARLERTLAAGTPFSSEYRAVLSDGSERWLASQAHPLVDPSGQHQRILGIVKDITERKSAVEAQQRQMKLLDSVTDSIPALIAHWTPDYRCTYANQQYLIWFGRDKEQMQGITLQELLGPELFRQNAPYIQRAMAGELQGFERQLTRVDGSVRHTWAQYIPDLDGGTVKGMFVMVSDITDLKQAQQQAAEAKARLAAETGRRAQVELALQASQALHTTLMQTMHNGFVFTRGLFDDGRLVDWEYLECNAAYETLMQVQGIVGRRASQVWLAHRHPDARAMALFERVIVSGRSERTELHLPWLDRWLSLSVSRPFEGHLLTVFEDVSERKKSFNRMMTLFASSPAAMGLSRMSDGCFVDVNDAFLALFGYERDEVVGHTGTELRLWQDPALGQQVMDRVLQQGHARGLTVGIITKSGGTGRVLASIEAVKLDGEMHVFGSLVDVSELERAQRRLQKSEQDYEALFRNMPAGFLSGRVVLEPGAPADIEFFRTNDTGASLLGSGPLDGTRLSDSKPPWAARFAQLVEKLFCVAQSGVTEHFEVHVEDRDRWFSGLAYSHKAGEFAAVFSDITPRKQRDLELHLAEARFQRLLNSNIIGVAIGDETGALSFANDYYLQAIGVTRAEMERGQIQWSQFSTAEDIELDLRAIDQVRTTGTSTPYEKTLRLRDGSQVAIQIGLAAIPGNEKQLLAILLDVTERRRAAEGLQRANEALVARTQEAEAANLAKSHFLSSINHELRTPLHSLLGHARLLLQRCPPDLRRQLDIIVRSGLQLNRLIDDLLQFSLNEQPSASLQARAVPVPELLQQLRDLGQMLAVRGGNRFHLDAPTALPEAVIVDGDRLLQVLQNLLGNACKYTSQGQVTLSVACEQADVQAVEVDRCRLRFSVTDTGDGISEQDQSRIFEAFQRGSSARGRPGLGLGLSIARYWVEAMGGQIQLDSVPGRGSRFSFALDVPISHPDAGDRIDSELPADLRLAGRRLLIVDDLEANRFYLRELCLSWGIVVTEAADGQTALELFKTVEPAFDALLVDQMMPGMDGWDLLLEVRRHPKGASVPMILVSASRLVRPGGFPPNLDFDVTLYKPFEHRALLLALNTVFAGKVAASGPPPRTTMTLAPDDAAAADLARSLPAAEWDRFIGMLQLGRLLAIEQWAREMADHDPALQDLADQILAHCQDADLLGLQALATALSTRGTSAG